VGHQHADAEDGIAALEGVRNFRDIGGLPTADGRRIRRGRYYRSGHLAKPTEADRAILGSLGIRLVVDLRSPADVELDGSGHLPDGARRISLPMTDPARHSEFWADIKGGDPAVIRDRLGDGKAEAMIARDYRDQVVSRTANHAALLDALVDSGLPAVVHCSAGKDRAGIAAALVQRVCGVPDSDIIANYLESNDPARRYTPNSDKVSMRPEIAALFAPFLEVREEYLRGALETMDTHWGGFDAYLADGLGFGPERQARLRELIVED
jgi:protein-tyrosine phosphatase